MRKFCTRTVDEILIKGDPDAIFDAASRIEDWPAILPHYRWVKAIGTGKDGVAVEMAAKRGCIPVKWSAVQRLAPNHRHIFFKHIGGATKGMAVEWIIQPEKNAVRVTIIHDLCLETPIVRSLIGRWIVANFFIKNIAGKTLHCIKELVESKGGARCIAQ